MTQANKYNDYKSYCLFNDIEDVELRNRNRAVVLANIAQDGSSPKTKRITEKAALLILGYFSHIEEADREDVQDQFYTMMVQRGYALVPKAGV